MTTKLNQTQLNDYSFNNSLTRQAIINGNFDVAQRNPVLNSGLSITDFAILFQSDRWFDFTNRDSGTLPTLTRTRQALTPGDIPNAFFYTRLTTNGAGTSLGVNSSHQYMQRIENGVRYLCGLNKKVTVSFWARSSITNKRICPTLQQNYGSGGSPSSEEQIKGTPITLTSTWTKYTATFTTNTLVGKTFGTNNDDYLSLNIFSAWGTTIGNTYVQTSVTAETFVGSGNIDIAQVQLNAGDVALPFMPKSFDDELRACKRYYEKSYSPGTLPGTVTATGSTQIRSSSATNFFQETINFQVSKLSSPTVHGYSAVTGTIDKIRDVTNNADRTFTADAITNENSFSFYMTAGSANAEHYLQWTAEAEL